MYIWGTLATKLEVIITN